MSPVELLEQALPPVPTDEVSHGLAQGVSHGVLHGVDNNEPVHLEGDLFDEDELLIEEISIDGMCGVY